MIYSVGDYKGAMLALLPPGKAWDFPAGGFGDSFFLAAANELYRVGLASRVVLDTAIDLHRHSVVTHTLADYLAVAVSSAKPVSRRPLRVGSVVGDRCWSHGSTGFVSPPVISLTACPPPSSVGSKVGDKLWSSGARFYLLLRFDSSIVDRSSVFSALASFKQAHVYIFFIDTPVV